MLGLVSTWMGDRLGTPGAVVFLLLFVTYLLLCLDVHTVHGGVSPILAHHNCSKPYSPLQKLLQVPASFIGAEDEGAFVRAID